MGSEEKRNDGDEKQKNKNKRTYFKKLLGAWHGLWRCLHIQGWDCDLCQPLVAKEVMNLFQMVSKSYYMHWIRFSVLRLYLLSAVIFSSVFIFRRLTEVRYPRMTLQNSYILACSLTPSPIILIIETDSSKKRMVWKDIARIEGWNNGAVRVTCVHVWFHS